VPGATEIKQCSAWIRAELEILKPKLVIAVGRLAIEQVLNEKAPKLTEVVGPVHRGSFHGHPVEWVALPHPSGLNTWYKTEPGSTLLEQALASLGKHPVFRRSFTG
jgi:uracil-DNA glycosylase